MIASERMISLRVNGEIVTKLVDVRTHLVDFLRETLELKGSHLGCEHGVCGACTLLVNDEAVRGCLMLAVQADGCSVQTIEGLTETGEISSELTTQFSFEKTFGEEPSPFAVLKNLKADN